MVTKYGKFIISYTAPVQEKHVLHDPPCRHLTGKYFNQNFNGATVTTGLIMFPIENLLSEEVHYAL